MDIDRFLIDKGLKTDCIVESDIDVDKYVQYRVKDLIKQALTKQLILQSVMPFLSQEIECVCGWEGKKGNLYYRERYRELNIHAQLECPECYTELVSIPHRLPRIRKSGKM